MNRKSFILLTQILGLLVIILFAYLDWKKVFHPTSMYYGVVVVVAVGSIKVYDFLKSKAQK